MGLIKAFTGSAFSYIGDMWEDYIYCDSISNDTLIQKGHAKKSYGAGQNADDNVITQFSKIAVNAGQMLIIVEDGKIIDFTAEQGGYEYNFNTEPSAFCGNFGDGIKTSFEQMRARFAYGGRAGKDQRAYFVNTKEILDTKFGFGNIPYRDSEFDITITLQGFGSFTFKIADPILFYTNISGNVTDKYSKSIIEPQLRAEIQDALLPALGDLARAGVRYDELPSNTKGLTDLLREKTHHKWKETRGIEIATVAFTNILPDDESIDKIRDLQESRVYSGNKAMLGARVGAAQANAMESAAENTSGAVNGFMGVNMAQTSGGVNVSELMRDSDEKPSKSATDANEDTWVCECGMTNYMSFCPKCGKPKPKDTKCPKCSFIFPKELQGMKFCPNCGNNMEEA
ncbi:MAG: SPFH domain-containing protein [Lachnospiraceae bacterium]|nr:SPFH domain-containing protein [Lachnospiraceae bacterium]